MQTNSGYGEKCLYLIFKTLKIIYFFLNIYNIFHSCWPRIRIRHRTELFQKHILCKQIQVMGKNAYIKSLKHWKLYIFLKKIYFDANFCSKPQNIRENFNIAGTIFVKLFCFLNVFSTLKKLKNLKLQIKNLEFSYSV